MLSKTGKIRNSLVASLLLTLASPALAQQLTGLSGDITFKPVCTTVAGTLYVSDDDGTCVSTDPHFAGGFAVGNASFDDTFNSTNFNAGTVQFNSSNVAFGGGSATFNNTVTFTGPSVTFSTGTTFQNPATFNGTTNFTAGMTTTNITNSGTINSGGVNSGTLSASTSLTASAGANVNMGGNQVHGVAAGTANTDAVNVAQLNAATSGITADVTALETVTATQTTQIAGLQSTTATHTTQINTLNSQVAGINTNVSALETDIDTLFDLRRQDRREARRGTAAAVAMSEAPMPSRDGGISYSLHGSAYRGEYGIGGSLKYRISSGFAVDVGVSHAGSNDTAGRIGVSGEF